MRGLRTPTGVHWACRYWVCCSSSWAGMLLLITCPVKMYSRIQVNTNIDDWKTTRWKDINVEQMDIDCKKFAKDIRSLDKEMRSWDAFTGLDNSVKNMITSLRAMNELQNPAIRDRHWQELMQATKVFPALPPFPGSNPRPGRLLRFASIRGSMQSVLKAGHTQIYLRRVFKRGC